MSFLVYIISNVYLNVKKRYLTPKIQRFHTLEQTYFLLYETCTIQKKIRLFTSSIRFIKRKCALIVFYNHIFRF
jgi:hypothetical protein